MPWLPRCWFTGLLSTLQQIEGDLSSLHDKVDDMATAQEEFRAAFASYQADVKAKLADLKDAIDSAVKAQKSGDDAAFKAATDEINAAHADLTAQVSTGPGFQPSGQ